jgi:hypothetical protein
MKLSVQNLMTFLPQKTLKLKLTANTRNLAPVFDEGGYSEAERSLAEIQGDGVVVGISGGGCTCACQKYWRTVFLIVPGSK